MAVSVTRRRAALSLRYRTCMTPGLIYAQFQAKVAASNEEDDLLDEIIPHHVYKRKFTNSSPKRQSIMTPDFGQGEQFLQQMPQGGVSQFAGGPAEELTDKAMQMPGAMVQGQSFGQEAIDPLQGFAEQGQAQEMQALGQTQSPVTQPGGSFEQGVTQQVSDGGVVTEMPENAKNFNENAAIETTLSNNGFRVTTDTKEKAKNFAKDVKNFGLWEYSSDNTAASTDQTAKILQSKLEEDDALLKGKDSESLSTTQVANAQGTKVDDLLSLFNKNPTESSQFKGLESLQEASKGLEAIDSATKGFTGLGVNDKSLSFFGGDKNVDGSLSSLSNDVATLESALGNQGLNLGGGSRTPEAVSVVNIPNTYSLEDEHGNSLDAKAAGVSGNHKPDKSKTMRLLKALLKKKLRAQAVKMLLKQKALRAAQKSRAKPTKNLKEQLALFLKQKELGTKEEKSNEKEDAGKDEASGEKTEGVSELDLKLLKFIKNMLKKGAKEQKGIGENQMTQFMTALEAVQKGKGDDAKPEDNGKSGDKGKEGKDSEASKKPQKAVQKEEAAEEGKEKQKDDGEESKPEEKQKGKQEDKQKEKEDLKAKKLKAIKTLLKHMKPTTRSSHGFFFDPEQPLSETGGLAPNSLMKYLEHESALLNQFQEGSQISDPAAQFKQRTTVSPTGSLAQSDDDKKKEDESASKDTSSKKTEGKEEEKESQKEGEKKIEKENGKDANGDTGKESKTEEKNEKSEGKKENSKNGDKEGNSLNDSKAEKEDKKVSFTKETGKPEDSKKEDDDKKASSSKQEEKTSKVKEGESETKSGKEADDGKKNEEKVKENDSKNKKEDEKEENYKSSNKSEEVKEVKAVPEIDGARTNKKPVEKMDGKADKESDKSSKFNDSNEKSEEKTTKDGESKTDDDDKTKKVKKLPEMTKLRNNKKIVSKINSATENETVSFKEEDGKKETAKEHGSSSASHEDSVLKEAKLKEEMRETETGSKIAEGQKSVEKSEEKENRKIYGKEESAENKNAEGSEAHSKQEKESSEQFDLYVSSKGKSNSGSERTGGTTDSTISESNNLKPQLPFLNPGNAHLDVLENDAGLKQYLLKKGSKTGSLQSKQSDESESSNENRLLQLKDRTAATKNNIEHKTSQYNTLGMQQGVYTHKARPNAVPPAGQGIPINSYGKAIKPLSRLQLKNKRIEAFRKLMRERNRHNANKEVMESGSLRHIAPLLADRLVDAPSVRLAALARLISMAKYHHKMIDVVASKKTLPSSKYPLEKTSQMLPKSVESADLSSDLIKPAVELPRMTTGTKSSFILTPSSKPTESESPESKSKVHMINLRLRANSVLVPSRTYDTETSNLKSLLHETESAPSAVGSRLISKTTLEETNNRVDPADVTRSRLAKPSETSIVQAMKILGDKETSSDEKDNVAIKDASSLHEEQHGGTEKTSEKGHATIMNSFFKKPTASMRNSLTDLSSTMNFNKKRLIVSPPTDMEKFFGKLSSPGLKARSSVHEEEAGKALIRKADTKNIVRTLKADTETANLMLRKRSRIPRARSMKRFNYLKRRV
eukprot:gene11415-21615_t